MALPEKIELEIVTPGRRVLALDVDEVILPGVLGSFGVLPGHAPLLAELGPGVAVAKHDSKEEVLAISGGFAEIGPGRVTVLAEMCERAAEIDRARAERKLVELESRLKAEIPAEEEEVLRRRMERERARMTATDRAS